MRILETTSYNLYYKKGKRGHSLKKKIEMIEFKAKCNTSQANLMCEFGPHLT